MALALVCFCTEASYEQSVGDLMDQIAKPNSKSSDLILIDRKPAIETEDGLLQLTCLDPTEANPRRHNQALEINVSTELHLLNRAQRADHDVASSRVHVLTIAKWHAYINMQHKPLRCHRAKRS